MFIIRPRYGFVYGSGCLSITHKSCVDPTDVTLVDKDTNLILVVDINRAFPGNVEMRVDKFGGKD